MPSWTWGYNTNGFAHHRLADAIEVLHVLGFGGVALTPDVAHLDVFDPDHASQVVAVKHQLSICRMDVVIETGARFVLDAHRKHYPSLLTLDGRGKRLDYLIRCVDLAAAMGAEVCSLWSGHNTDDLPEEHVWDLLLEGLEKVVAHGEACGVTIAMEPEPGMFIETLDEFLRLSQFLVGRRFGLALDVGHLMVTGETPIGDQIRRVGPHLATVAIEDMVAGVHDHLPFGQGDIDFAEVFDALSDVGYDGLVSVELSRASPNAVAEAKSAWNFLHKIP